jgi:type IV pilus assembly protein PilA
MKIRTFVQSQKGFSLVELMVVVSIIGILAAIAIPNFQRFTAKAKQGEAKSNLAAVYSAERAFQAEWGTYTSGFNNVGYRPSGYVRYAHGWTGNFGVMPTGYPNAASWDTTMFNSTVFCAGGIAGANGCQMVTAPVAPGALPAGTTATATAFIAGATANIGAAGQDQWTINQAKNLQNTLVGLP